MLHEFGRHPDRQEYKAMDGKDDGLYGCGTMDSMVSGRNRQMMMGNVAGWTSGKVWTPLLWICDILVMSEWGREKED